MAVTVTHETTATAPNDPAKEVSSDAWNAGHTVTGLGDSAEKNVGTAAGTVAAGDHLHTGVYEPAGVAAADITDSSATGRSVLTGDAAGGRTALGVVIGTNVQAHSAVLDATTASFTSADETKLDGIAAGATAGATWGSNITSQPAVVGQAEAEAGSATTERIWTAQRVSQAIAALAPSGSGFTSVAIQTVAASGDYTPTSGMKYCICFLTGSGGGGGGADSSTTTNDIGVGGGGGAGTTRIGFFSAAQIGASKAVVLNAGGSAGSATNGTNGGTPSDNTFGSTLLVAPGGLGGVGSGVAAEALNANLGGAGGGAGSGGVFGAEGGGGGAGYGRTVDGTVGDGSMGFGGMGGSSFWGGGGLGGALFSTTIGVSAVSAGTDGKAYGSGGGGAISSDTAAGAAGGAGKIGIFVAIEFI